MSSVLKGILSVIFLLVLVSIGMAQEEHESVVILLDVSRSVAEQDLSQAVKILKDMNSRFPDYVRSAGLMTFGVHKYVMTAKPAWNLPVTAYDRNSLAQALDEVVSSTGSTPLGVALKCAREGIEQSLGKTALIIVSDGLGGGVVNPLDRLKELKDSRGDALCVFSIQMGDSRKGAKLLRELVEVGGCGLVKKAGELTSDSAVQAFVDYIFPPRIPEPAPPPEPEVETLPEPVDTDEDGVLDIYDLCMDTPRGAKVDNNGCWQIENIEFEFDSAKILPESKLILDEIAHILKNNPDIKVFIEGYTDDEGSDSYNLKLSQERADSVLNYLVAKGVEPDRLTAKGYGESRPIADNTTEEGRAKNRRIEFIVIK